MYLPEERYCPKFYAHKTLHTQKILPLKAPPSPAYAEKMYESAKIIIISHVGIGSRQSQGVNPGTFLLLFQVSLNVNGTNGDEMNKCDRTHVMR